MAAASQRLDPAGELSEGAYWLLISQDDGSSWPDTIYTGLRINEPYVLVPEAAPLVLQEGTVRLKVLRHQLKHDSISFPPTGLAFETGSSPQLIEVPLEVLRLDTDGDSLPDIVEQRLLLDPTNADSDGDGQPDALDALPRVPQTKDPPTDRAEILSRFFFRLSAADRREAVIGQPLGSGSCCDAWRDVRTVSPSLEDTLYVIASADELAGVNAPRRIISMAPWEFDEASRHFGMFFPLSFELFFNASGDQAFLEWNERWRGGAFLATKRADGHWELKSVGSWVS